MTQARLASRLGVTLNAVSRWECGLNAPAPDKYRCILEMVVSGISNDTDRQQHILSLAAKLTRKK